MAHKRVSIIDVAELAGVSRQTVSRVINNAPSVNSDTRKRVEEAIVELNYRPSLAARSLVSKHTRLIGLIAAETHFFGPLLTIDALEDVARRHGLYVSIATVHEEDITTDSFAQIIEGFLQLGVEALIIVAPTDFMLTIALETDSEVPRVIVTATDGEVNLNDRTHAHADSRVTRFVGIDQVGAMNDLASLVSSKNVRRAVYVSGPLQWRDAYTRMQGWMSAARKLDIVTDYVYAGEWSAQCGFEAIEHYITDYRSKADVTDDTGVNFPQAIVCANDLIAFGVRRALGEYGISVPDDVMLVGYDDMPGADNVMPPLTTVRPNYRDLGSVAMQHVLDLLNYEVNSEDQIAHSDSWRELSHNDIATGGIAVVEAHVVERNSTLKH